jgi:hypothetical protein
MQGTVQQLAFRTHVYWRIVGLHQACRTSEDTASDTGI